MKRILLALLALVVLAHVAPAMAQGTEQQAPAVVIDKKKLLVQPRSKDGASPRTSFVDDPALWIRDKQQAFYGRMSGALRQLRSASPIAAAWTLMLLSFGYGVFHAAGPGHGKAVISAWLLATENELRRGILISLMSAIIQALTAIAIVSALLLVAAGVGTAARDVAGVLESASYGLIGLMGLYLIWMAFRGAGHDHASGRDHVHRDDAHETAHARHFDAFQPRQAAAHHHTHGPDCGCGHTHVPEARDVKGHWSLARAFSLAFAVGIRPCTGALLVLIFASGLGLYWAGIASAFAMAFGTFVTVSAIAAVAVYSKKLALRLAGGNSRRLNWLGVGLRFGGGAVIAFLGAVLFLGSLGETNALS